MTREDQILTEAAIYTSTNWETDIPNVLIEAFKKGAEWADENPPCPWISVKDDLPCNHDDFKYFNTTILFLTRLEDGDLFATYMRKSNVTNTWHWVAAKEVTHWMSIPKLNAD